MTIDVDPVSDRGGDATAGGTARPGPGPRDRHHRVVVIGTGFAGIGAAIRLRQAGIHDVVVLERADDVGGTWRDNHYPGCQCDVPSNLYSFSFAPNPAWSRTFAPQGEIWAYLQTVTRDFGVTPHIRFGHEVLEARWDDTASVWRIRTNHGEISADVVISGHGGLSEPAYPELPGLDTFAGAAFHSADWHHEHDLAGERVAVIGTGASAIQFVPAIQPRVGHLDLYQRTPPWIVPRPDRPFTDREKRLYRSWPLAQKLNRLGVYLGRELLVPGLVNKPALMKLPERLAREHLRRQVADPELRAKLTPHFQIGCKRILLSNDYYPSLTQPNVDVLTDGVAEVRPHSIVGRDGVERPTDTIIYGTGFKVTDHPVMHRLIGRNGRSIAEHSADGSLRAYYGTTVPDFPNLFLMTGPNTGLGHNSIVFMIESQLNYVVDCLRTMDERGLATVEVRTDAVATFDEEIQRRLQTSVWNTGGCASWYLDANSRNTTLWPGFTWEFRRRTRRFDPEAYTLTPARRAAVTTGA